MHYIVCTVYAHTYAHAQNCFMIRRWGRRCRAGGHTRRGRGAGQRSAEGRYARFINLHCYQTCSKAWMLHVCEANHVCSLGAYFSSPDLTFYMPCSCATPIGATSKRGANGAEETQPKKKARKPKGADKKGRQSLSPHMRTHTCISALPPSPPPPFPCIPSPSFRSRSPTFPRPLLSPLLRKKVYTCKRARTPRPLCTPHAYPHVCTHTPAHSHARTQSTSIRWGAGTRLTDAVSRCTSCRNLRDRYEQNIRLRASACAYACVRRVHFWAPA
jgi:hypothetical protein